MSDQNSLDEAIIFSGKHVGHWDDDLTKLVRDGHATRLLLDIPSLKAAINKTIMEEVLAIIGEDEPVKYGKIQQDWLIQSQNELRAELRQAITKKYGAKP